MAEKDDRKKAKRLRTSQYARQKYEQFALYKKE